jgi:hypothetical protein
MRPHPYPRSSCICGLALLLAGSVASAEDGCPSLSGCAYQAGQGLPGHEPASRQPAPPEVRPPAILNSCDAGGCTDTEGTRHNGRAAEPESGVYLDPQGRRCVRNGDRLQCG